MHRQASVPVYLLSCYPSIDSATIVTLLWNRYQGLNQVYTILTEQISRRFPGGISRKIQDMFALLRHATQCTESTSLNEYRTKTWYAQHRVVAKIKKATSFINKRSGTQFYHDWKPMQSIIDMLHKNFQEDHTNSRRFPGFPGGFLNSIIPVDFQEL